MTVKELMERLAEHSDDEPVYIVQDGEYSCSIVRVYGDIGFFIVPGDDNE